MNRYIAFLKVFERNSFSDAARDLGYTQSAVSQMIKSLEEELGVTLLVRSRSGVALTYEGRQMGIGLILFTVRSQIAWHFHANLLGICGSLGVRWSKY